MNFLNSTKLLDESNLITKTTQDAKTFLSTLQGPVGFVLGTICLTALFTGLYLFIKAQKELSKNATKENKDKRRNAVILIMVCAVGITFSALLAASVFGSFS